MDNETIKAYNMDAANIAELHLTLTPHRIYQLIDQYFIKNTTTIDIGCGIGRDTYWLNSKNFPAIGVDASVGMLTKARDLFPDLIFQQDHLPTLVSFGSSQFQNILCSAVLMHLHGNLIEHACNRLFQLLKDDGRLIISMRGTHEENKREKGKLYEDIDINFLIKYFKQKKCQILVAESEYEKNRELTWHNFVIKK